MESALLRAQIVADTIGQNWNELNATDAKAVLRAARETNFPELGLFCKQHSIREPVAAGATRFRDYLEDQDAQQSRVRRLMLVIDSGAGTTDFALFQSLYDADKDRTLFALISKAVGMSRVAGNRFDTVLRPLILKACKIHPENGSPWDDNEFAIIKADLSSQIRSLKQQLFISGSVSISLRPGASGLFTLKELENEIRYQELGQNLIEQRNAVLRKAFTEEGIEAIKSINSRVGRAVPIYVLLSGGSSQVPPVKALASGRLGIDGASFEFVEIAEMPRWIRELPRELAEFIGREFLQCAVALGGSASNLPSEQSDFLSPILPPREGERRLERFQVTGT
jgi:molecular chaperone DnaK (HSP70)